MARCGHWSGRDVGGRVVGGSKCGRVAVWASCGQPLTGTGKINPEFGC